MKLTASFFSDSIEEVAPLDLMADFLHFSLGMSDKGPHEKQRKNE